MIHKPNTLFTKNVIFFSLLLVILFLESCATKKDILYIQTPDNNTFENIVPGENVVYKDYSLRLGASLYF